MSWEQVIEWFNFQPAEHLPWWLTTLVPVLALVIWVPVTSQLVDMPWRLAWSTKDEKCKNFFECKYVLFLMPWGLFMIPVTVLLWAEASLKGAPEDLLLRTLVVVFSMGQTYYLQKYMRGSHQHKR